MPAARPIQPDQPLMRSGFWIGTRPAVVEIVAVVTLPYLIGGLAVTAAVLLIAALLACWC